MDPQTQPPTTNKPQIFEPPSIPPQTVSKLPLMIGIVLTILIVGTGISAWYNRIIQIPNLPSPGCYYQKVQCMKAPCNPILVCDVPSPTPPTPTPTDETSNWKTYLSVSKAYEVKIPINWNDLGYYTIDRNPSLPKNDEILSYDDNSTVKNKNGFISNISDAYRIEIINPVWATKLATNTSLLEVAKADVKQNNSAYQNYKYDEISVGNYPAIKVTNIKAPLISKVIHQVYILKDEKIHLIVTHLDSENSTNKGLNKFSKTFDKILSTFKFLDQNQDETTNWKIYTNSQYGYSVKYPSSSGWGETKNDTYLTFIYFSGWNINNTGFKIMVRNSNLQDEIKYQKSQIEGHVLVKLTKEVEVTINGFSGVLLEYTPDSPETGPTTRFVIVNNGKYSYTISGTPETLEQILSTFKFSN